MSTGNSLTDSYYMFCVVFVTIMLIIMVGFAIYIMVDETHKRVKYYRQRRQSRKYLKEVIGRVDEVHEDEAGVQAKGILYHTDSPLLVGPLSIVKREPRPKTHFTVLADGEIINNFPNGQPGVDNRT